MWLGKKRWERFILSHLRCPRPRLPCGLPAQPKRFVAPVSGLLRYRSVLNLAPQKDSIGVIGIRSPAARVGVAVDADSYNVACH